MFAYFHEDAASGDCSSGLRWTVAQETDLLRTLLPTQLVEPVGDWAAGGSSARASGGCLAVLRLTQQ